MGKILSRRSIESSGAGRSGPAGPVWYGAVLDADGREIPITEAMIQRALAQLDAQLQLPCPHHLAQHRRSR